MVEQTTTAVLIASGALFGFHATCMHPHDNILSHLVIKTLPMILGVFNLTIGCLRLLGTH